MAKQPQRRPQQPQRQAPAPQRPTPEQPQRKPQTQQAQAQAAARKAAPAPVRRVENRDSIFSKGRSVFIYGRQHFIILGAGLALVLLGLATMAGGAMPDPNTWEPERIYSFQRITLAPILMVAGFVVVIFGIFKKSPVESVETSATVEPANTVEE